MILPTRQDGVLTLTIDRPDKANALTQAMLEQLEQAVRDAHDDPDLRALILTGAGERVFSSGADLDEARAGTITRSPTWEALSSAIASLPFLTIAALNGTLAGGAFGMALACDLRIAVASAKFFYPVLKNGFLPQPRDAGRMSDLIGPAHTKMILMAGQKIDAKVALSWGLVDELVEREAMSARLEDLTAAARAGSPAVLTGIKRLISSGGDAATVADAFAAVYQADKDALDRLRRG